MPLSRIVIASLLLLSLAPGAQAQSCSSKGAPRPRAVLERFVSADCDSCWRDPRTPAARAGQLAIDWVVPGRQGDDAPLSAVAIADAEERLVSLRKPLPRTTDSSRHGVKAGPRLRIAQGEPVNDYVGTLVEARATRGGPFDAWLLLVESLPAGAEGSPVARNLVRNAWRFSWDGRRALDEIRSMQVHEGARLVRLHLVALVHDASGRLVEAVQTRCDPRS